MINQACNDDPCTCENPEGVEVVVTGLPNVQMLACTLCGVLLWDIQKHYAHAHPADVEIRRQS